ncbi:MAG: VapE domain-containing protein [Peptostreptococcaceae bacterium]
MFKQYIDAINSLKDLEIVINHYYPNYLKKNKMNCPFHKENTPSFSIADKGNGAFYHCFGCGESGGIINFIQKIENITFIQALKKAYEILGIPIDLPNTKNKNYNKLNKNNAVEFYNKEANLAISQGNIDKAFELSCKSEEEQNKNYIIKYPYLDDKNVPFKIWENMNEILKVNNITVAYNEITKDVEIEGLESSNPDNRLVDIHSLCTKYGFKLPFPTIDKFINRIGEESPLNPVIDYLRECYMNFDGNYNHIQALCDAIITPEDFDPKLKKILITKWLLNTAMIPFNEGDLNIEGILTLQGRQGLGKTRLIKKLIPMYVKTGLELDPSDKDKVYQCIKYWVAELGELDATFKRDLSKLKAFITEQNDEFRRPYAIKPVVYPRKTSFYATVNNDDFLKDETGNRRYWVIPVKQIDFSIIDGLDIEGLWGEVMHIKEDGKVKHYLEQEELDLLNSSNEEFKIYNSMDIAIDREFKWDAHQDEWTFKPSMEIAGRLSINSTKGMKTCLLGKGAKYKKVGSKRGYDTPPYRVSINF